MEHSSKSKELKDFLAAAGILIDESTCHNVLTLRSAATGETVELEAISEDGVAFGIPGIYVTTKKAKPAITVKVGKYIPPPVAPKNEWHVELQQMSGDADAYDTGGAIFKNYDDMIEYLTVALEIEKIQNDGEGRQVEDVETELKLVLNPELFKRVQDTDYVSEICGYDVTCEGCLASVEGIEVFWYDTAGVKYECDIEQLTTS